jgi:predicted SAM-dependent methyltransferase
MAVAGPFKLDLACGPHKASGFYGVDKHLVDGVDLVCNLTEYPWPFEDGSVDEVRCSHYLEHLTGTERIPFMNELWRVLRVGTVATITVPYWTSQRSVQDPTHQWPPLSENSFLYFDRDWRRRAGVDHYLGLTCDFTASFKLSVNPEGQQRSIKDLQAIRHEINTVDDLTAILTKVDR